MRIRLGVATIFVLVFYGLNLASRHVRSEGLSDVIYTNYEGDPCVLLLDKDGAYGCRTLSKSGVSGALELVTNLSLWLRDPPADPKIIVMPLRLYATPNVIDSLAASKKCLGLVLIQDASLDAELTGLPSYHALKVPQNATASNDPDAFKWNPNGSGYRHRLIPFPIWKLNTKDSKAVAKIALENREKGGQYPLHGAEITAYMHPAQGDNSIACLKRETCKPLGGHSTISSPTPLSNEKETILVMASMDGASLFQLQSPSAVSDMSGLVAMMGVIDALAQNNSYGLNVKDWPQHQVLFAAFDAESYGYLGSRQFIRELQANKNPLLKNVSLAKLSHVIEAKQVGSINAHGLYIHSLYPEFATSVKQLSSNLGPKVGIPVGIADTKVLGMPPTSLKSFDSLQNASFVSLVLTDHESNYTNAYFDSVFDDYRNVNADMVCAASTLLLRAIVNIGSPASAARLHVNCTLIEVMLDCLTRNVSCSEALALLPKFQGSVPEWPSHYPSVFDSSRFSLHQRFVHDWIFDRSATNIGKSCNIESPKCAKDEACLRGTCKQSNTHYMDATSPNVKLVIGELFWYYQIIDEKSTEPLWVEADWTPIGFRTFIMASPAYDYAFAAVAVLVACATIAVTIILNVKFTTWFRVSQ